MKKLPQDKIFFKSQNQNVFSVDPTTTPLSENFV